MLLQNHREVKNEHLDKKRCFGLHKQAEDVPIRKHAWKVSVLPHLKQQTLENVNAIQKC